MDFPKCKICGERHRLGGCPESASRAAAFGGAKRREKLACGEAVTQRTVNAPIAGSNPAEPAKKRAPRGSFDRTAYQREYMRKRRASGKVDKWDRKA